MGVIEQEEAAILAPRCVYLVESKREPKENRRMCNPGIARLAVLLLAMWTGHGGALPVLPPLEQEVVNPGEVIFRNGVAYIDLGHGRLEPLRRRQQDGVYYRMVRYDAEFGYVRAPDATTYPDVDVDSMASARRSRAAPVAGSHDIESRIKGRFEGWTGKTLFLLENGQIWQQTDGRVQRAFGSSPRVTLRRRAGGHEMSVEGVSATVTVRQR